MSAFEIVIRPRTGWQAVDWDELWRYRELFGFLIWRDIKIRYKQTLLGSLWALLQPLTGMLIFGLVFSRVVDVHSDGPPYLLFVFTGLVPWMFFQNAVALSSNSLVGSEQMIRKIYFPRLMIPLAAICALGIDMIVSLVFLVVLMVWYQWPVSASLFWLPAFMLSSIFAAGGLGLFLSTLNVRYRDIKYVVPFFTQMVFFLTPVLYPMRRVPAAMKPLLTLNPMAGIVEGFRHAILGSSMSWTVAGPAMAISVLLFVTGLLFFRRMERSFADVI